MARSDERARTESFRRLVWNYYRAHGRHDLPWRLTHDPYKILVSEMMLQQTQVSRVISKYEAFLKAFPTMRALARASLSDVLKTWSGLGYNRRAKYLHEAAKTIPTLSYRTHLAYEDLRKLPGVGEYTAKAIRIFAYSEAEILIETNIRAAYINHFFDGKKTVHDREIVALATDSAKGQDPRQWHWALMDYGAHLKATQPNPSRQSAHYTKQSKFEGSLRQVRGSILRSLANKKNKEMRYPYLLPFEKGKIKKALTSLERDGLIKKEKGTWRVA